MENTDHKNEGKVFHDNYYVGSALSLWQEWGIILLTLVLFLIAPLCCIILGHIHRNRAWAENVRMIGYVVLVLHIMIVVIILCDLFDLYEFITIPLVILLILPVLYIIWGFLSDNIELKSAFFKVGSVTLILSIAAFIIPQILGARRTAWANRCKLTLRTLGSSQVKFKDENPENNYGTWEEMYEDDYIQEGYNRRNMIDNYSIAVFSVQKSTLDEKGNSNLDSSFTIAAIPRIKRKDLRTFALGDDQTPCVWVGKSEEWTTENVTLHNIDLWEPLR